MGFFVKAGAVKVYSTKKGIKVSTGSKKKGKK
jgi:hypothetical protein